MKATSLCVFALFACLSLFSCKKDDTALDTITINFDETVNVDGNMKLTFDKIEEDSRCPCNVECITAGRAVVRLIGSVPGSSFDCPLEVNSTYVYKGYEIKLLEVLPLPCDIDLPIPHEDYKVKVTVKKIE